jgi:hypothetical protein
MAESTAEPRSVSQAHVASDVACVAFNGVSAREHARPYGVHTGAMHGMSRKTGDLTEIVPTMDSMAPTGSMSHASLGATRELSGPPEKTAPPYTKAVVRSTALRSMQSVVKVQSAARTSHEPSGAISNVT